MSTIAIKGARENNLKNIDIDIPKEKLVIIAGDSGSGKTSLAFDVIHQESQRIFTEALSLKSRGGKIALERAQVDSIEGLSPTIAIKASSAVSSRRSTIATSTDILYFLRTLYEKSSKPHCPTCHREITVFSLDQIVDDLSTAPLGSKCILRVPLTQTEKDLCASLAYYFKKGFIRYTLDGKDIFYEDIDEAVLKANYKAKQVEIVVDRFVLKPDMRSRLAESVDTAVHLNDGRLHVEIAKEQRHYNTTHRCFYCEEDYPPPSLRLFTFNHPEGACNACQGTGEIRAFSKDKLFFFDKSINEGGILYFASHKGKVISKWLDGLAKIGGFDTHTPLKDFTNKQIDILMHGRQALKKEDSSKRQGEKIIDKNLAVEGIVDQAKRRLAETDSEEMIDKLHDFTVTQTCGVCQGARLNPYALACTFKDRNISDLLNLSILALQKNLCELTGLNSVENTLIFEINKRLQALYQAGLGYLCLNRPMNSLSGGEENRIKIANQINSSLTGVTYIFDEPSKGLHPIDIEKLMKAFRQLVRRENTVILIEHKPEMITLGDFLITLGPGAGEKGGEITYHGVIDKKVISKYQLKETSIKHSSSPKSLQKGKGIIALGVNHHNIRDQDLFFPFNQLTVICGVSGSGKSSLVEVLYPYFINRLMGGKRPLFPVKKIEGIELFEQVYWVDQSPIGGSRRSIPATYLKVFDLIRQLYAGLGDAKVRGYGENRFSFNAKGGRCEVCKGLGDIKVNMHLLPDIFVRCQVCRKRRYLRETLEIKYKEKNIAEVLDLSFDQALAFFSFFPLIAKKIKVACDIGLGYLKLGQASNTLSGGEHQRLKLALEMGKSNTGPTLYLFDEPTTGLSLDDIDRLMFSFKCLIEQGHTLLIVEHHLRLIHHADYLVELGPGGGDEGGKVIYCDSPNSFLKANTPTSQAYADYLKRFKAS